MSSLTDRQRAVQATARRLSRWDRATLAALGIAVSDRGVLAVIVEMVRCDGCGVSVPDTHQCPHDKEGA